MSASRPDPSPPLAGPAELVAALDASPYAKAAFAALPPSHQREHVQWIAEATQPQSRAQRAAQTVDRLLGPTAST